MLQEGVSDHRQQGVSMKTLPGSSFEVIESQFLLHLLMRLHVSPVKSHCAATLA